MLDKNARAVVLMMFPLLSVCANIHSGFGGLRNSGINYQSPFGPTARILNSKCIKVDNFNVFLQIFAVVDETEFMRVFLHQRKQ
jgi:hypothetical protein